jgi:hypothetical protein
MAKKPPSPAAKTPAKSTAVRKVTVRDLEPGNASAIKAGAMGLTIGRRCR